MKKFKDAFRGLRLAIKHKAVLIQVILAIITLIFCLFLNLAMYEFLAVIICIGFVISSEIFNTCIERICDFIEEKENEKIAIIKDMAAAAVLVSAIASFAVMALIILRRVL